MFPKWIDIIDLPFIALITFISLFKHINDQVDYEEHRILVRSVWALIIIMIVSSFYNYKELFEPAAILFALGILQGPLLYISLNKIVNDIDQFAYRTLRLFFYLLLVNMVVVIFIDIPRFIVTRNPDVMSGTFGLNAYQFSVFLVICGGLSLGLFEFRKFRTVLFIISQAFIVFTFFLLQYRAALLFFILAYTVMIIYLYGIRLTRIVVLSAVMLLMVVYSAYLVISQAGLYQDERQRLLKYDDWMYIFKDPGAFLKYGKFKAYPQTAKMLATSPITAAIGAGPGNYVSRAFNTFSSDIIALKKKKTGPGPLAMKWFGLSGPRYTSVHNKYLKKLKGKSALGTFMFSAPNSSFLAPIGEIGLIGGGIVIALYVYVLIKSLRLLRLAKNYVPEYLPLATALVGVIVYVFGLAFLDNYWEMSRVTLPLWLLFWATNAGINHALQESGINHALQE